MPPSRGSHAMSQLPPQQSRLLDKTDALRAISANMPVELPQLIIISNLSSEKSTVLEVISGVHFPDTYHIYRCPVTEIVLRRDPQTRIHVSIESGEAGNQKLRETHQWSSSDDELPALLEQAKKRMDSFDNGAPVNLSERILRIKISGPETPHLTLVDLSELDCPIFQYPESQVNKALSEVARNYLKSTRSLFLAVINVEFEGNLEGFLDIVKLWDSKLERTFGVISQPQKLTAGSNEENNCLKFIKNEKVKLQLGWHIVRDRSFETCNIPHDTRDEQELAFFDQGKWSSLPREVVDVENLRRRLSSLLAEHTLRLMPAMTADVEQMITDREQQLIKLKPERKGLRSQRGYLLEISSKLQHITEQALGGVYTDDFFGSYGENTNSALKFRGLRAVIRELNESFAEAMNIRGCRRIIGYPGCPSSTQTDRFNPYMAGWTPKRVDFVTLQNEISEQAGHSRGTELPGAVNQFVVGSLFRDQAEPWKELAATHLNNAWAAANYFICQAVRHLTDEQTYSRIVEAYVHPEMERLKEALVTKLSELTLSIERRHPLPVGKSYLEKIRKSQHARQLAQLKSNLGIPSFPSALQSTEESEKSFKSSDLERAIDRLPGKSQFEASAAIEQMQEYYDSALMTFVDNVAMLAIENCLLLPLQQIFTTQFVNGLSEERIQHLAAEQPGSAENRERLCEELGKLRQAKRELNTVSMDSLSPPPPPIFASQPPMHTGFESYAQSPSPFHTPIINQGPQRGPVGSPKPLFGTSSNLAAGGSTQHSSTPKPGLFEAPTQPPLFGTSARPSLSGLSAQGPLFGTPAPSSLFGTSALPPSLWGTPRSSSSFGGASAADKPTPTTSLTNNAVTAIKSENKGTPPSFGSFSMKSTPAEALVGNPAAPQKSSTGTNGKGTKGKGGMSR